METKETPKQDEPLTRRSRPLSWRFKKFMALHWRGLASIFIPLILLPIALVERTKAMRCAYMILVIVLYWIMNIIPYAVTAMFPIFILPLFDIESSSKIGTFYFSNITCMLVLSILVARSIEQSNVHKRVAIAVLSLVGFGPKVVHVFLLSITMFISMFIPNIATSAIMFPIIKAVLEELENNEVFGLTIDSEGIEGEEENMPTNEAISFYLGLAYAANIGGLATMDGSGIALTFVSMYESFYPTEVLHWGWHFLLCFPLSLILGVCVITYLQFMFLGLWRDKNKFKTIEKAEKDQIIKTGREPLGRITYHEIAVIVGFIIVLLLLFFRAPPGFNGYSDVLNTRRLVGDSC